MAGRSEHLADHDSGDGGKERDAQRGEGVLTLRHGHGCDHTGTEAGHGEL